MSQTWWALAYCVQDHTVESSGNGANDQMYGGPEGSHMQIKNVAAS